MSVIVESFRSFQWTDSIDIAIIAVLIFVVLRFLRRMGSWRVLLGALVLATAAYILAKAANLRVLTFLMSKTAELGLFTLIIVFQPEIRRMLNKVGEKGAALAKIVRNHGNPQVIESAIEQVVDACAAMSESRTGALIIFERQDVLDDKLRDGIWFDAEPQPELLKTIFYEGTPLHDGAMLIRDGRIAAAACYLPLTAQGQLSKELGTRHRAAIGISEVSDAVTVVVSEETGKISIAIGGNIVKRIHAAGEVAPELLWIEKNRELTADEAARKQAELENSRNQTRDILRKRLKKELLTEEEEKPRSKLRQWFDRLAVKISELVAKDGDDE